MAAKKKAVLFLAACLLGLAAYLYHAFCQQDNQEELVLQGNVDVREVSLAFRQSDRILEMLAEEGDRVQKGQVLARLDTQELKLQLQRLNAEIAAQQSTRKSARRRVISVRHRQRRSMPPVSIRGSVTYIPASLVSASRSWTMPIMIWRQSRPPCLWQKRRCRKRKPVLGRRILPEQRQACRH